MREVDRNSKAYKVGHFIGWYGMTVLLCACVALPLAWWLSEVVK